MAEELLAPIVLMTLRVLLGLLNHLPGLAGQDEILMLERIARRTAASSAMTKRKDCADLVAWAKTL